MSGKQAAERPKPADSFVMHYGAIGPAAIRAALLAGAKKPAKR
ncbi:MAG: hypothetical protein R3D65_02240 [Zhengella sp.]